MKKISIPLFLIFLFFVSVFIGPINKFSLVFTNYLFKFFWLLTGVSLALIYHFIATKKEIRITKHKLPFFILIFILYASLSYLWSENTYEAERYILFYISYFLIFITYLIFFSRDHIILFEKTIVFLTCIVSVLAIIQTFLPQSSINVYNAVSTPSLSFGNKNMFGHALIMLIPVVLTSVIYNQKRNFYYLLTIFLSLFTIFLINAMQLYVALFAMMIFMIIYDFRTKDKILISAISNLKFLYGFLAFLLFVSIYVYSVMNISTYKIAESNETNFVDKFFFVQQEKIIGLKNGFKEFNILNSDVFSRNQRIPTWVNSLALIKDNFIFGLGAGQWGENYIKYYDSIIPDHLGFNHQLRARNPHNEFIRIFSNLGLIGFVLVLLIVFQSLKEIAKAINSPKFGSSALGFTLGLIGFFVISNFSKPAETYFAPALAIIYLALILVINNAQSKQLIFSSKIAIVSKTILAFFLFFVVYSSYKIVLAQTIDDSILSIAPDDQKRQKKINQLALKSHKVKPNNPHYLFIAGLSTSNTNNDDLAIQYFNQALERAPNRTTYLMNILSLTKKTKDYKKIIDITKRILEIDPREIRALVPQTIAYFNINEIEKANQSYKKLKDSYESFKGREGFDLKHQEIVNFALSVGDYRYAAYVQSDYVKNNPSANAYAVHGIALYNIKGKRNEAQDVFLKALKIDPEVYIPEEIMNDLKL